MAFFYFLKEGIAADIHSQRFSLVCSLKKMLGDLFEDI